MDDRSVHALETHIAGQQKFDYFVLGVIGALVAYLAQAIDMKPLGLNAETVEFIALLTFMVSGVFGFKRIEASVEAHGLNSHRLRMSETKGQIVANFNGGPLVNHQTGDVLSPSEAHANVLAIDEVMPEVERKLDRVTSATAVYYKYRNLFLFLGFVLTIGAKLIGAYENA